MFVASIPHLGLTITHAGYPGRAAGRGRLRQLPVVDDEPSVRRSLVRMLQAQGFNCFEAGSGREALAVLERIGEAPLVISDMRMPEMDGIGLLEARPPALPRHLGHHAHRHERDDHRGRLPPPGRAPTSCSSRSR